MSERVQVLPIDGIGGEFRSVLGQGKPVVVTAPTGSGKSTRLPVMAAEAVEGPVLVVQPRRVAARSLAERVAEEQGRTLGREVGYAVRFDEQRCADTRILFVTPGVALRLFAEGEVARFGAVIIDEFHERGWQTDLLAALARAPAMPPLVLTSATVDGVRLAEEIGAVALDAPGRTFPVDVAWAEDVDAPSARGLTDRVVAAVRPMLATVDGDVLVFLPGRGEIRRVRDALGPVLLPGWELVEVHGGVSPEKLQRAFRASRDLRRCYLATNVAETSLTLPGVVQVVDTGLERRVVHRAGRNVLALLPIARSAMDQRAGRAGRVRPGACLRLWSRRWRPRPQEAPELERIALDEPVYRAALAGLDGEALMTAPWVTPPPAFAVDEARERLHRAGLLDARGHLTELGRSAARLPVDAHEARLLTAAPEALRPLFADLLASLTFRREPLLPLDGLRADQREDVAHARRELLRDAAHEPAHRVHVLRAGDARRHHIDRRALEEARRVARQLRDALGVRADRALPDAATWAQAGDVLLRTWPEAAFVLRARAKDPKPSRRGRPPATQPWTNGDVEVELLPFVLQDADHVPDGWIARPEAGVLMDIAWIGDGATGFTGRGSLLLPLRPERLAAAGIGEEVIGETRLLKRPLRIVGRMERRLAEVVLEHGEAPLRGEALRAAAASFILEGRLYRPAGEALLDALHLLGVIRDLPSPLWPDGVPERRPEVPDDAAAWLEARLAELGLERVDELALLEAEDLALDLEDATGWPSWELERWAEEFPRIWVHLGAEYACAVRAASGKVVLSPANGEAKRRGPPDAAVLPRFRGFRVRFEKASRVVPLRG
ncbi:MAG: ATP-dependent RNA helicase [Deltaproteobacteria bacterium]|nr:MAG: ATP-dependent RNA helicase [Deltaproteobacteria bacterium]